MIQECGDILHERMEGGMTDERGTVCPQKIRSLGIDTIFDAIFYEDSIKNKVYNCWALFVMVITKES